MKTLIYSRLAVFALLFVIIGIASFKTDKRDLFDVASVSASEKMPTGDSVISDYASARPVVAAAFNYSQTVGDVADSTFENRNLISIDRFATGSRRRILPENRLIYRQSLFDTSLFKREKRLRNFQNIADRRPNKNKSSPLLQ